MKTSSDRADTLTTLLKLSPLLLPILFLFGGGLAVAFIQSLGFWLPVPVEMNILDAYRTLLQPHFAWSALYSLYVALVSALLAVAIGAILAYGLWCMPQRMQQVSVFYKIPLILPHISVAFITLLFWSDTGIMASICFKLGLIESHGQFPSFIYGGNGAGMIMAYVCKGMPFVILLVFAVLKRMDPQLIHTARMLGASEPRIFWQVAVPHMGPALHTAFIILFLYAFGAFDIPFLLGESNPSMLAIEVYNLFFLRDISDRPTAMAVLVIMFLLSVLFISGYTRVASHLEARERKL